MTLSRQGGAEDQQAGHMLILKVRSVRLTCNDQLDIIISKRMWSVLNLIEAMSYHIRTSKESNMYFIHCLKSKTELWDTDELFHSIERRITLKGWVNINSYHALEYNLSVLGKNLKFWFLFPSRIIPSIWYLRREIIPSIDGNSWYGRGGRSTHTMYCTFSWKSFPNMEHLPCQAGALSKTDLSEQAQISSM